MAGISTVNLKKIPLGPGSNQYPVLMKGESLRMNNCKGHWLNVFFFKLQLQNQQDSKPTQRGYFSRSCCYKCELGSCFSCSKKKEQEESRKWLLERGYEINLVRTMPTHAFARIAQQASPAAWPTEGRKSKKFTYE